MHLTVLALTGVVMGSVTTFVGLDILTEVLAWIGAYVLWVAYGLRMKLDTPVRTMAVASTLSGLLNGSIRVLFLESYKQNNSWYAEYYIGDSQTLAIQFLGQGIVFGLVLGLLAGVITAKLLKRRGAD